MLGVCAVIWILTPVIASFGTLVIPGLDAAVFTPGENHGSTAGDSPVTLYIHLAWVVGLACIAVLVLNLTLGVAKRHLWLPVAGVVLGVAVFVWLVVTRGGALWMWDIAPVLGVGCYLIAQLANRISP